MHVAAVAVVAVVAAAVAAAVTATVTIIFIIPITIIIVIVIVIVVIISRLVINHHGQHQQQRLLPDHVSDTSSSHIITIVPGYLRRTRRVGYTMKEHVRHECHSIADATATATATSTAPTTAA